MPALALLLPSLALGALLPQLPELLRVVEQAGNAFLAHSEALTLALPCQGRREVPVVIFKHFAHPRERRAEALSPERDVIEVNAVIARGECQKICARAVLSDIDEPFAEDDGELCFGLEPFPRRTFPRLGRMIENEI